MNELAQQCYVYQHRRNDTGEVFYVGVGYSINYKRAYNKRLRSPLWKEIAAKYGRTVEILADNLTLEEAYAREIALITKYGRLDLGTGPLVNRVDGGKGGLNPSPEVRRKLSQQLQGNTYNRGKPSPLRGIPRPEEVNRKVAKSNTGKRHSEESRAKMSRTRTGRPLSEATKAKMSRSAIAYKGRLIINLETGIFYETTKEAAFSTNINPGTLNGRLRGYRKNNTSLTFC